MRSIPKPLRAILVALGAFQIWACGDVLVKLGGGGFSVWQLGVVHSGTALLCLVLFITATGKFTELHVKNWREVGTFAVFSVLNIVFYFLGLSALALVDYYTIIYIGPLVTSVLAAVLLKEKIGQKTIIALIAGFIGALIAIRFGILQEGHETTGLGIFFALCAMLSFCGRQISVRIASQNERTLALLFYAYVLSVGVNLTASLLFSDWSTVDVKPANLLIPVAGLSAVLGHVLNTKAMRAARRAAPAVAMTYTKLITGALLSWFLWEQGIATGTLIGAAIIIAAGLYLIFHESEQAEREQAKVPPEP